MRAVTRHRPSRLLASATAALRSQGPAWCEPALAASPAANDLPLELCRPTSTAPVTQWRLSLSNSTFSSPGGSNSSLIPLHSRPVVPRAFVADLQSQSVRTEMSVLFRGMSTHVGHGSGGREKGHNLHEPPEGHPFAVKGLNHIALAVPKLNEASEHYRTVFGAQVSDPHPLPEHGVTVVFVHIGSTTIELLEPLGEHSPIAKFLEKNPRGGIHHLCFTVDNIDTASQHVVGEGVRVLGDYVSEASAAPGEDKQAPKAQLGAHGNPVIFLDPRDNLGVLCELEQVFCHER